VVPLVTDGFPLLVRDSEADPDGIIKDAGGCLKVWDAESGELHRELEGFGGDDGVTALVTFLSPDGQQPRLVAGSCDRHVRVYDPEAGSTLHYLRGHTRRIGDLACIASSSAAPHHPRVVSISGDGTAKVWDGETGEMLADLGDHGGPLGGLRSVAVWKEHTGGHDRIATAGGGARTAADLRPVKVWDGKAFTLIHDLHTLGWHGGELRAFQSAEGPARLLVAYPLGKGLEVWDPEEGRRLHHVTDRGCLLGDCHLLESAQGRHLLATVNEAEGIYVWDLGEAPAAPGYIRPAHKQG
jgi:WD40 repeat protein